MKTRSVFSIALLSVSFLMNELGFPAEDQINETVQEQSAAGQGDKVKELKRQQDFENIRRQNEIDRLQRDLDTIKQRSPQLSPAENARTTELQRQLDQLRNDQQMQRLKNEPVSYTHLRAHETPE